MAISRVAQRNAALSPLHAAFDPTMHDHAVIAPRFPDILPTCFRTDSLHVATLRGVCVNFYKAESLEETPGTADWLGTAGFCPAKKAGWAGRYGAARGSIRG